MYLSRVFQAVVVVIAAVFFLLPDTYAVVGNVNVVVTDGQGNAMTGCTFRITNTETGESHESTTDERGALKTWMTDDGDCSVEVVRNGETISSNDVSLAPGPQNMFINTGDNTLTSGMPPFLQDTRVGVHGGWGWPGGHADSGPLVGGHISVPICQSSLGQVRGVGRFSTGFHAVSTSSLTQRTGPGTMVGPGLDAFPFRLAGSSARKVCGTVGGELENPTNNRLTGPGFFFVGAGAGVMRNYNDDEAGVITAPFPDTPSVPQRNLQGRDDTGPMGYVEVGFRKPVNSAALGGRNVYLECYAGFNFSHSEGQSGNGANRAAPYGVFGISVDLFGSNSRHRPPTLIERVTPLMRN